jgi:hypothetical protein
MRGVYRITGPSWSSVVESDPRRMAAPGPWTHIRVPGTSYTMLCRKRRLTLAYLVPDTRPTR